MTFVRGDAAAAAKALADFRRSSGLLTFKGGWMNGEALSPDQMDAIARLPTRDVLYGRLVGMVASPLTGLVTSLGGLIGGLARQLGQIAEQGLVGGEAPPGRGGGSGGGGAAPAAEDGSGGGGSGSRGAGRRGGSGRGARPRPNLTLPRPRIPRPAKLKPRRSNHGQQHPGVDRRAQADLRARAVRAHQGARGGVRRVRGGRGGGGTGRAGAGGGEATPPRRRSRRPST